MESRKKQKNGFKIGVCAKSRRYIDVIKDWNEEAKAGISGKHI